MVLHISRRLCIVVALAVWTPAVTGAQTADDDALAPPHLSLLEGDVQLERAGRAEAAGIGHILAVGDRLHTRSGRAEIVFGDGSALHVDRHSTLDLLDEWLLRLVAGQVFLHVAEAPEGLLPVAYRIDTPAVSVRTAMAGEYRVSAVEHPSLWTDVAVARGVAEVTTNFETVALHAGERVRTRAGEASGRPFVYNAAAWDGFDRWSYDRRRSWGDPYAGAALPRELAPYASTLARHGSWSHHPSYGQVWYPHVVSDWRPFYHGHWTVLSPYGWTWIGSDRWAWPTHYYGTWGFVQGRWFWRPGRGWAPARVHWAVAPGFVGWLPFGIVHHVGWTVIPRSVFQINVIVPRHAVRVSTLRPDVRSAFVSQTPPAPRVAVPRASIAQRPSGAAATSAARVAVSRNPAITTSGGAANAQAGVRRPGLATARTPDAASSAPRGERRENPRVNRAAPQAGGDTGSARSAVGAGQATGSSAVSRRAPPSGSAAPSPGTATAPAVRRAPGGAAAAPPSGSAAPQPAPRTAPAVRRAPAAAPAPSPQSRSSSRAGTATRRAPSAAPAAAPPSAAAPGASPRGGSARSRAATGRAPSAAAPAARPAPAARAPAAPRQASPPPAAARPPSTAPPARSAPAQRAPASGGGGGSTSGARSRSR